MIPLGDVIDLREFHFKHYRSALIKSIAASFLASLFVVILFWPVVPQWLMSLVLIGLCALCRRLIRPLRRSFPVTASDGTSIGRTLGVLITMALVTYTL